MLTVGICTNETSVYLNKDCPYKTVIQAWRSSEYFQ